MPAYTNDSGENGRRQLFGALVTFVVALSTAFLPTERQQQLAALLRGSVLRPFVSTQAGLQVARGRTADSGVLRRQLDSLNAVTSGHLALREENRRLLALMGLTERIGGGWIAANVVRPGTTGAQSMFLLNVGSAQGVQPYSPVVAGQGIVGYVFEVHENDAVAMDWTHPDFRASAMDEMGTVYGIVKSRRGEFREEDRLEMDGTAFQTRLEDGTVIVTSNLSGIFPRGIPIGKVEGLAEADAGWRKSYFLRPMVEVGSVTHVLVGVESSVDLFGVWPLESALTDAELALVVQARDDSLRALGDSVALLRTVLTAAKPVRDSVLAALLLGQGMTDSLAPSGGALSAGAPGGAAPGSAVGVGRQSGPARGQTAPATSPARGQTAPGPAGQTRPQAGAAPPAGGGDSTPRFPRPTDTLLIPRPDSVRPIPRPPTDTVRPIPRPPPDTLRHSSRDPGGTGVEGPAIRKGGASRR